MKKKKKTFDDDFRFRLDASAQKVKTIIHYQTTDGAVFESKENAIKCQFHLDSLENKKNKGETCTQDQ